MMRRRWRHARLRRIARTEQIRVDDAGGEVTARSRCAQTRKLCPRRRHRSPSALCCTRSVWSAEAPVVSMNLDKALGLMGVAGAAPPPVAVDMGNGTKKAQERAPETKKQKEAREAKEKLEKKKAKIAAAMFKKDEPKAKEKKEKPAAAADDAAAAAAPSADGAPAAAAETKPKAKPVRAAGKPRVISEEERKRAIAAERRIADEAERAFATAYQCASTHVKVSAEAIDYHVRSADELEEARREREANAVAAAAAKAQSTQADAAKAAISKAGCLINFDEWQLLVAAAVA